MNVSMFLCGAPEHRRRQQLSLKYDLQTKQQTLALSDARITLLTLDPGPHAAEQWTDRY